MTAHHGPSTSSASSSSTTVTSTKSLVKKIAEEARPRDLPRRMERTRSESSFESITESEDETEENVNIGATTCHSRSKRSHSLAGASSPCLRPRRSLGLPLLSPLTSTRPHRKHSLPNLSREALDELLPPISEDAPVTPPPQPTPQSSN